MGPQLRCPASRAAAHRAVRGGYDPDRSARVARALQGPQHCLVRGQHRGNERFCERRFGQPALGCHCWLMLDHRFPFDCRLGSEWVDSGANWLDDLSRLFDADPLSRELGFEPCELNFDASWWSDDWDVLWNQVARLLKDQALDDE